MHRSEGGETRVAVIDSMRFETRPAEAPARMLKSIASRGTDVAQSNRSVVSPRFDDPRADIGQRKVRLDTSLDLLLKHALKDVSSKVLATVVSTVGSTYRKAGARMLVMADGRRVGLLTGGCLEADLALHARAVLESGRLRTLEYDTRGPDDLVFGIGSGCEGAMRILLEPAGPESSAVAAMEQVAYAMANGRATSMVSIYESNDVALGSYSMVAASLPPQLRKEAENVIVDGRSRPVVYAGGGRRTSAFVQFVAPVPHVLVCGAGLDAAPVASMAIALGWQVTLVDHRPAYALAERFPGATVRCSSAHDPLATVDVGKCDAIVVMSHHLQSDVTYLRELARRNGPAYVALLGPPARRQTIMQELGAGAAQYMSRVRSPVGIDIGAVTPEGIALSIVAQIHAALAGRLGGEAVAYPSDATSARK
jgi:xanthine dehydrogenase accessory factor